MCTEAADEGHRGMREYAKTMESVRINLMFRSIYFRLACAPARPRPRGRAPAAASVQIQTVSMLQSVNGVTSPSELLNIVGTDHRPQESSVGTGS